MKRTSSSMPMLKAAANATATTTMGVRKLQQLWGLIAIVVAFNCLQINLFCAAASDDIDPEEALKAIREKCIAANKLTDEQAQLIFKHKLFSPATTLATTPKSIQCYCLCYLHESKIFIDNKPNEPFLRENLPIFINDKKKASDVLEKCLKLQGADACEIGFNFEMCLIKDAGLYYI